MLRQFDYKSFVAMIMDILVKFLTNMFGTSQDNANFLVDKDDDYVEFDIRQRMFGSSPPAHHQIWTAVEKAPPTTPFG